MARYSFNLIFLIGFGTILLAQKHQIIFEQHSSADIADCVQCIYQDSRGFLWFGNYDALIRYDGYSTITYQPVAGDTFSISANQITSICEDTNNRLWIGTLNGGVNRYNRFTDKFIRYQYDAKNPGSISENNINTIFVDSGGIIWIGTENGLNKFNPGRNNFFHYMKHTPGDLKETSKIKAICEIESGLLLIGTDGGLQVFDITEEKHFAFEKYYQTTSTSKAVLINVIYKDIHDDIWVGTGQGFYHTSVKPGKMTHYPVDSKIRRSVISENIQSICDGGSFLWLGTADGLLRFDKKNKSYTLYEHDPDNFLSLKANDIPAIFRDRSGCYWFSASCKGLHKINTIRKSVKFYFPNPFESASITDGVLTLCESKSGKIWIGTDLHGVLCFDKRTDKFKLFKHDSRNPRSLSHNYVYTIIEDRNGFIWIGTQDGLNKYDPVSGHFEYYRHDPGDPKSLCNSWIQSLYQSVDGSIYIGTWEGLSILDPQSGEINNWRHNPLDRQSINPGMILSICEDSNGIIWLGTNGNGLDRFEPESGEFAHYVHDPKDTHSLPSNIVEAIFESEQDSGAFLWIGSKGGGLSRFDKKTEKFMTFTTRHGLSRNQVRDITEDREGNLWLATVTSITRFSPSDKVFKNFEVSTELPVNSHTCLIDQQGELFFGGQFGFVRFFPDSMYDNPYIPPIMLTDLKVNHQSFELDTVISEKKNLVLSYLQNIISFDFTALDYNRPEINKYAFMLEGSDNDWIYTDATRRNATYTNLDPGEYIFKVKGTNNNGVWNEKDKSVYITITPPWWRTHWAYSIYILLVIATITITWYFQIKRIRLRTELKIKRLEAQKLQEVDNLKSRFFANISHEFRTPLTLILGPVSKLLTQARNNVQRHDLQLVIRNAKRLQRLIAQLLDLSRLEAGRLSLRAQETDLYVFLNRIVQSFESQAKLRNIKLCFENTHADLPAFIDREKMENVLYNLLSNAFKFTPIGGAITVRVENLDQAKEYIRISVSDTGKGIADDKIDHIFDRFYQIDDSYTREHEGSGIGLALVKELVELHHGKIEVTSEVGKGTHFTIFIPTGRNHLTSGEIISVKSLDEEETIQEDEESRPVKTKFWHKSFPVILIVEDNPDMLAYIVDCLQTGFRIFEAGDGESGFDKATKHIPELIISDVMMPHMDGFTFCHKIKTDQRTSHIPVILLTARASDADKISGLETGADDYIIKPFNEQELRVRIKNLIEQRKKLRERFSRELTLQPLDIAITSADEKFLQKILQIIEKEISNPDFNIDAFVKEAGISRANLYRKIQALSGQSAKAFIRTVRLKHAARFLEKRFGTIAEIAYEVGFSNPAYFSECFRKQFGLLPSEYASQVRH